MLSTILIIVLVLMLLGALPVYPHSRQWGYSPVVIILVVLVLWLLLGHRL